MAKPKRSAADLDAELAALEAELAALEGKKKAPSPPARVPAPSQPPAPAAPEPPSAGTAGSKWKLGRRPKKALPPPAPPERVVPPASSAAPQPPSPAAPTVPDTSALAELWRREGDAWVRTVPGGSRAIRRVLDEQGNVVREEPVDAREADATSGMKAERGAGKILGRFRR